MRPPTEAANAQAPAKPRPSTRRDRPGNRDAAWSKSHPVCGYLETWRRIDVWPDSVQVPGGTLSHSGCPPSVIGVALIWLAVSPGAVRGEAQKGFAWLEVAVPSSPDIHSVT
jgi:hypothetical protein